jgi:hypothetical protein
MLIPYLYHPPHAHLDEIFVVGLTEELAGEVARTVAGANRGFCTMVESDCILPPEQLFSPGCVITRSSCRQQVEENSKIVTYAAS